MDGQSPPDRWIKFDNDGVITIPQEDKEGNGRSYECIVYVPELDGGDRGEAVIIKNKVGPSLLNGGNGGRFLSSAIVVSGFNSSSPSVTML